MAYESHSETCSQKTTCFFDKPDLNQAMTVDLSRKTAELLPHENILFAENPILFSKHSIKPNFLQEGQPKIHYFVKDDVPNKL